MFSAGGVVPGKIGSQSISSYLAKMSRSLERRFAGCGEELFVGGQMTPLQGRRRLPSSRAFAGRFNCFFTGARNLEITTYTIVEKQQIITNNRV